MTIPHIATKKRKSNQILPKKTIEKTGVTQPIVATSQLAKNKIINFIKALEDTIARQKEVIVAKKLTRNSVLKEVSKRIGQADLEISENVENSLLESKLKFIFDAYNKEFKALEQVLIKMNQNQSVTPEKSQISLKNLISKLKFALNEKLIETVTFNITHYKDAPVKKSFDPEKIAVLKDWFNEHWSNPYPSDSEKIRLAYICDMLPSQISTWFGNYRGKRKGKLERRIEDAKNWIASRNH